MYYFLSFDFGVKYGLYIFLTGFMIFTCVFYFRKKNAQIKKCCVDQGNRLLCISSPVSMCCWYFLTDFLCLCLRLSGFPREEASMHKPRACILPSGSEHPRCSSQPSSQW